MPRLGSIDFAREWRTEVVPQIEAFETLDFAIERVNVKRRELDAANEALARIHTQKCTPKRVGSIPIAIACGILKLSKASDLTKFDVMCELFKKVEASEKEKLDLAHENHDLKTRCDNYREIIKRYSLCQQECKFCANATSFKKRLNNGLNNLPLRKRKSDVIDDSRDLNHGNADAGNAHCSTYRESCCSKRKSDVISFSSDSDESL